MGYLEAFTTYVDQDIWQYFKDGRSVINGPPLKEPFDQNGYMGHHGTPFNTPLFIYKAISDNVTPIYSTDVLVNRYCEVGVDVLYERNTVGDHLSEMMNGNARAVAWLQAACDGTRKENYGTGGCEIRNVSVGPS
ncbi:hypothetical protein K461DRAFT_297114 [Myriangium duriaei CBS 260.36]|uniref:Lipase n=1 Tax=Myriangium duriaei CBS 260.36 TaxID=1168546 RepID=A0A9P4ME76_9PEZI|nr:hypothetical protein K461DRAFT_297114 [Myriangium duriaei CBS 260.36]